MARGKEEMAENMDHGRGTNRSALVAMRFGLPCTRQGMGTEGVPYVLNRFLTTGAGPVDAVVPVNSRHAEAFA